jgi:hypothetical protein
VNNFPCATIVAFRATLVAQESGSAMLMEESSELEIALTAKTKLFGCARRALWAAFPFDKHGKFSGEFIIGVDG